MRSNAFQVYVGVVSFDPCVHLGVLLDGDVDDLPDEVWVVRAGDADVVAGVAFHHALAVCAFKEDLFDNSFVRFKELCMQL